MTPPRAYRAGLGLPAAIIISSSPGAGPSRLRHHQDQSEGVLSTGDQGDSVDDNVRAAYSGRRQGHQDSIPREETWKEWNINPTSHGPPKLTRPPVFVLSSTSYDELGRSLTDGVGVHVDQGEGKSTLKEDGLSLSGWYSDLARRSTPKSKSSSNNASGTNTPENADTITAEQEDGLDGDDDEEIQIISSAQFHRSHQDGAAKRPEGEEEGEPRIKSEQTPSISRAQQEKKLLKVHSRDWFIRRALLTSHSHSNSTSDTTSTSTSDLSSTGHLPRSTSISGLLNITPNPVRRTSTPRYVLGPENKGYEILQDRLGWHGGGLGRPVHSPDSSDPQSSFSSPSTLYPIPAPNSTLDPDMSVPETLVVKLPSDSKEKIQRAQEASMDTQMEMEVEFDGNGHPIVDLTMSSDSEAGSEAGEEEEDLTSKYGPGRTAPIATTLKLDKKGLGHRHSHSHSHSNGNKSKSHSVTHTHAEIEAARKKAKYGTGRHHGQGLELGKKGKVKWKIADKRDRDERMAIKAALA